MKNRNVFSVGTIKTKIFCSMPLYLVISIIICDKNDNSHEMFQLWKADCSFI